MSSRDKTRNVWLTHMERDLMTGEQVSHLFILRRMNKKEYSLDKDDD